MSVTEAPDLTAEILEAPPHQSNVFSAWSDGFSAGLIDLDSLTHRAYERGRSDVRAEDRIAWLILSGSLFIAGLIVGILAFA